MSKSELPIAHPPEAGRTPLVDALLGTATEVSLPSYDRGKLRPAAVHIGVGGFHRAHQAMYFDDLAEQGERGWGVVGVGLHRPEIGDVLREQYGLFTVVERGPEGDRARVVGSITRFLFAPEDPEAVLEVLAAETTQLVTMTVTGSGYPVGPDGKLRTDDAGVRHDLANPRAPQTMVGFLVAGLRRRRDAGLGAFTVLSCDNLPDSGRAAHTAVTSFARMLDPELATWIDREASFPNSMVDRITPETSTEVTEQIQQRFSLPDRWPIITEPFRQWIVEDSFCGERPPLDKVGVRFVDDVGQYKLLKARVLNGGHSALGYVGSLLGYATTDQAMEDPAVRRFLAGLLNEEVAPLLPAVDGIDVSDYVDTTLRRFANPAVRDELSRLCRRGSVKMPSYLLPSLQDAVDRQADRERLVLVVAAWLRYLRGTDLSGEPLTGDDPRAEELRGLASAAKDDPRPLLELRDIFGRLADDEAVVSEISTALQALSEHGASVLSTIDGCQGSDAAA